MSNTKRVLFTYLGTPKPSRASTTPFRKPVEVPGWPNATPPTFLIRDGKLFQHKGGGMTCEFYQEIPVHIGE